MSACLAVGVEVQTPLWGLSSVGTPYFALECVSYNVGGVKGKSSSDTLG